MRISNELTESIEVCYQRAQSLIQGLNSKTVAFNTTVIPHWMGLSDCFWYERESGLGKEFRLVNVPECSNQLAFDHQLLAEALALVSGQVVDADNLPITHLIWELSPLKFSFDAFGKRWTFDEALGQCEELSPGDKTSLLSPDASQAAFLRDYNLWVRDLKTGKERQLTSDGEAFYQYAVGASARGGRNSHSVEAVWSPDSTCLLTLQEDKRSVKSLPIMNYVPDDGSLRPQVAANRRVAYPGDKHTDQYRLLAIEVGTGKQQAVDYPPVPVCRNANGYFSSRHAWWSSDNRHGYFIEIDRGGDHVARLVMFDTHTGATRILIEEESPDTFFKLRLDSRLPIHTRSLPETDELLWFSERSGWGHLYLYNQHTGELKNPVTQGEWVVRDIHHYDPERRELIIQTSGRVESRHAYYRDICRVNIDTGELTPIIASDDEYVVFDEESELAANLGVSRDIANAKGVSPTGRYMVTTQSRVDTVPVSKVIDREGNEIMTLETADISGLPEGWQWPEPVKLLAADGNTDIYGVVYRPSHFCPEQSYPVLDSSLSLSEGGYLPAGSFTNNSVAGFVYFNPAALAELGFIVVDIYGRGTMNRNREFTRRDVLGIQLPDSEYQKDRISGIRQLADRYPSMDLDRVGVGGNVSSAVAISGLLGAPDFYKVGVANGACFDLRITPAFFGESYGDLPHSLEKWEQLETFANNLQGKLLITHGVMAPSVTVAQTFRLVDALEKANKDFDMLVSPSGGYGVSSYALRRGWDYLVTHLLGAEPPKQFKLVTPYDAIAQSKAKQAKSQS